MSQTFKAGDRVRYIGPFAYVRPLHSEGTLMKPKGKGGWYVKWDMTSFWDAWTENKLLELISNDNDYVPDLV